MDLSSVLAAERVAVSTCHPASTALERRPPAVAAQPIGMEPSVSVIVTCHDYGHFLDACLDSLAAQTRHADQLVVVDDGSIDASRSVLRARKEPLTVIEKENGGQASAFNAGFAVATGDIVLFLDADDTLAPDALEAVRMAWHDSLAALSFRLNLIDAAGRCGGFYAIEPREGDMRPELLSRGHFEFLPTSGNAFNRRLVAPAFPLPEARWRISADAVLIRAAALAGPMRQLPFALGNYRVHGGNGYYRAALPRPQSMQRAMRDIADSCLAMARSHGAVPGPDPDIVRLDLLLASLRTRLGLADHGEGRPRTAAGPIWKPLLGLRVGLRARLLYGLGLPLSLRLLPRARRWLAAPERMPRALGRAFSWVVGPDLARRRRAARRARWLPPARAGRFRPGGGHAGAAWFNAFDWRSQGPDGGQLLCGDSGEIVVPVDRFPDGARIDIDLKAVGPHARTALEAELTLAGHLVGRTMIHDEGCLSAVIEPAATLPQAPLELKLSVAPRPASFAERLRLLAAPAGLIAATELRLRPLAQPMTGLMLSPGDRHDFATVARACQLSPPVEPDGPDRVEGGELVLRFARPTLAEATELVVRLGEEQVAGTLVAMDGDTPACRGSVGGPSIIRVPVHPRRSPDDRELLLSLSLDPDDPFEAPGFHLSSIGLAASAPDLGDEAESLPVLAPGVIWQFEEEADGAANPLGDGWTRSEAGAELFDTIGILHFAADPSVPDDAVLHMRIAPAAPLPEEVPLAVAVTAGDEVAAQVLLQGEHELAVPLGGALAKGGRCVELAVHAAYPAGDGESVGLERAGLLLKSIRLSAKARQLPVPRPPPGAGGSTLGADIEAAAAMARKLHEQKEGAGPSDPAALVGLHRRIVTAIRALAPGAVLPVLLNEEMLGCLCDLGEAIAEAGADLDGARPDADCAGLFSADTAEAVRSAALAMLTVAPWRALAGRTPAELPDALRAFPSHLARYLCSTSHEAASAEDRAGYRGHVLALMAYARERFCLEARGSRHDRFAEELLRHVRLRPLLFGPGSPRDAGRAFGAALEAFLLARGRRITLADARRAPSGRPRLGVLIRSLLPSPEASILAGTVGALPPDAFDVTVFVAGSETGASAPIEANVVNLGGIGPDRAVEVIRAAQIDVLLLGSSFDGYDDIAAIAAHRLAPLQLAATAISPAATGLKSFDAMPSAASREPREAAADDTEQPHLTEAPQPAPERALEPEALGRHLAVILTEPAGQSPPDPWHRRTTEPVSTAYRLHKAAKHETDTERG